MDDKQLAMLLTAMNDQTAAMNRMADAMTGILLHLDPKQAAKLAAPGYQRPLAAYATFDWDSIEATLVSWDRHGATEVEHNGVAYRRYRSNDDDPKGVDIRFRRVVSGTPEGKNMVWATLIKFADKKAKDAPRPLRGELAEKIEQAAAAVGNAAADTIEKAAAAVGTAARTAHQPSSIAVAVAPTTPAPRPVHMAEEPAHRTADVIKADLRRRADEARGMRPPSQATRTNVFLSIKYCANIDIHMRQIIRELFGAASFKDLTDAEVWALHGWLKPGAAATDYAPTNPTAVTDITTLLAPAPEMAVA